MAATRSQPRLFACPIAALSSYGSTAWCCYAVLVQALVGGMPGLTFPGSPFSPFATTPAPSSATPQQSSDIFGEFVGPSVPCEVWTLVRGPPASISVVAGGLWEVPGSRWRGSKG